MSHSSFLTLSCCSVLLAIGGANAKGEDSHSKPNVLFVAVDDLNTRLGCYGNAMVRSPHIDQLAKRGVRFDRVYCQFPLCNPSRTSLLTGRYPTTTGVLDNLKYFRDQHPDFITLPQHFRAHGYVTARVGKIFHGGIDDAVAWVEGGEAGGTRSGRTKTQQQDYRKTSDRWEAVEGEGEKLPDYRTASGAIELLEKYHDKPFFLAVGFVKPHSAPVAPRKYFDLYDPSKIPLPPDFAARPKALPEAPAAAIPKTNGDLFIDRDAAPAEAREMIRAYYACISFIDAQLGRVLNKLDELHLAENTVIVFWGDHGYHLGEKGKWSKHGSLYEVATRVPLIIAIPRSSQAGKTSPRTVELVDLYPTLCELCGLPKPTGLEGDSLKPLVEDPTAAWTHPARTVLPHGRTVRTERWRYTQWRGGSEGDELYDHTADPHELKNLARDPQYAAVVKELTPLLIPYKN